MQSSPQSRGIGWRTWALIIIIGVVILVLILGTREEVGNEASRSSSPLSYLMGERVGDCAEAEWQHLLWTYRDTVQRNGGEAGRLMAEDGCSSAQVERLVYWFTDSLVRMQAVDAVAGTLMAPTSPAPPQTEADGAIATLTPLLDSFNASGAMDATTFRRMCAEAWAGRDVLMEAVGTARQESHWANVARFETALEDLEYPLVECANSGQFPAP